MEEATAYTISVVELFIAVFAVLGNAFIILVFFKDQRLHKRKTNFLFASQAFSDFFVGLTGIPLTLLVSQHLGF
jgi:hypothetical protein